jgi:hypothetical protein
MVVGFKTSYAICRYDHYSCEFQSHLCEVHSIQRNVIIKFVSDMLQVDGFLRVLKTIILPIKWKYQTVSTVSKSKIKSWACVTTHLPFYFEETLYGTFNGASYQFSVNLAKRFQRGRLFRYLPMRNTNFLWQPYLLTDQN